MTSLTETMNRLPAAQRKRVEERAAAILAEERARIAGDEPDKDRPPPVK